MLPLAKKLLNAAGFEFDDAEQTWVVPMPLRPVVTVECDGHDIMDALLEVHAVLEANDCTYNNFSLNGRYLSIVGLTEAPVAVVA
jgi:hypothetical protein